MSLALVLTLLHQLLEVGIARLDCYIDLFLAPMRHERPKCGVNASAHSVIQSVQRSASPSACAELSR